MQRGLGHIILLLGCALGALACAATPAQERSGGRQVEALKAALSQGAESAVERLGRADGFLGDERVRIPLPDSVQPLARTARRLGQGQHVDRFETAMNRAAERAVPEAAGLLAEAIRNLSIADAVELLRGQPDAATRYFRKQTEEQLHQRFLPIVTEATAETDVSRHYNALTQRGAALLGRERSDQLDLNEYVTGKAIDGLFVYIAEEEKRIRDNPAARGSDLLRSIFGSR